MQSIEWRPVPNYEGLYKVSDTGVIVSLYKGNENRPLRPAGSVTGHLRVSLRRDKTPKTHLVHRLVAHAFLGPCPPGYEVLHRDGDPGNNALANIHYGTRSENVLDQVSHGVHNNASRTHCKNGHEFTSENTLRRGTHGRRCRTCNDKWQADYRRRRRERD